MRVALITCLYRNGGERGYFRYYKRQVKLSGRYKPIPVPREDLLKIMGAGAAAPSGCNKQTTSFIAVDDKKLLDEIKALIEPPVAVTAPAFILLRGKFLRTGINALMFRITARLLKICC